MSTHDESAAFFRHLDAERARLAVTGDTTAGGPPVFVTHNGVTIWRVYKDGEPFTRTFQFATAPVRSEFDDAVFDVRALTTWEGAQRQVMDWGGRLEDAIVAAVLNAIDQGVIPGGGDDAEACPGCRCRPGDGITPGCEHPLGCGFWRAEASR